MEIVKAQGAGRGIRNPSLAGRPSDEETLEVGASTSQRPSHAIVNVAERPELLPDLAAWLKREWSGYYAGGAPGGPAAPMSTAQIEDDLRPWLDATCIPLGLVALEGGMIVGTVALREFALHTQPRYRPGVGGLHVLETHRRRGIGTALLRAGTDAARALGYPEVYVSTSVVGGILARLGWEEVETVLHYGEAQTIFRYRVNVKREA